MTDRELMQMVLRALKNAYSFIPMKMMEKHLQAETALRDRLAQPEREWVGFTHEELGWLNEALNLGGRLAVIEAIEAKLKEKNS
jgi:hypothetical protein